MRRFLARRHHARVGARACVRRRRGADCCDASGALAPNLLRVMAGGQPRDATKSSQAARSRTAKRVRFAQRRYACLTDAKRPCSPPQVSTEVFDAQSFIGAPLPARKIDRMSLKTSFRSKRALKRMTGAGRRPPSPPRLAAALPELAPARYRRLWPCARRRLPPADHRGQRRSARAGKSRRRDAVRGGRKPRRQLSRGAGRRRRARHRRRRDLLSRGAALRSQQPQSDRARFRRRRLERQYARRLQPRRPPDRL